MMVCIANELVSLEYHMYLDSFQYRTVSATCAFYLQILGQVARPVRNPVFHVFYAGQYWNWVRFV